MTKLDSSVRRIIGLTGGIATGKTTVSNYLANRHGLSILDADLYAREAVCSGSKGLERILDRYGSGLLLTDGSLDRAKLGRIVFEHSAEKQWLESIIHPFVRDRLMTAQTTLSHESIVVMAVPLLFEANMTDLASEIWVVICPASEQMRRLRQRDHLTEAEAQARIQSQWSLDRKCAQADVVLNNESNPEALYGQIDQALST